MATVDQTMMKVQRILTASLGLKIMLDGERIRISFSDSSTQLILQVRDWGKDPEGEPRSLVLISAPILLDVTPTPEVFEWVARHGGARFFGHVEVIDTDDDKVHLIFSHTLLGDYLDQPELEAAMWGILRVADEWDDELQPRFGGQRYRDV